MTAKCANPACATRFRYLRGGKLFLVDSHGAPENMNPLGSTGNARQSSEVFWLCERCSQGMRIAVEKSGEVVLITETSRQPILRCKPPQPERELTPVRSEWALSEHADVTEPSRPGLPTSNSN